MHFVGIVCGNVAQRLVKLIGNPVVARAVASSGGNWKERVNGEASFIQLQTDTHSHTHKHTGEYVAVKFKVVIEACCQWPTAKEIHPSIQASSDMQRIINNPFTQLQLAQQACGRILFWGCPITVQMCVCVCQCFCVCVGLPQSKLFATGYKSLRSNMSCILNDIRNQWLHGKIMNNFNLHVSKFKLA